MACLAIAGLSDHRKPITIAVMGPVGSGKTTLIKVITKNKDIAIEHSLARGALETSQSVT